MIQKIIIGQPQEVTEKMSRTAKINLKIINRILKIIIGQPRQVTVK